MKSLEKLKLNQVLGGLQVYLALIGFVALGVGLTMVTGGYFFSQDKLEALKEADALAMQLLSGGLKSTGPQRNIASAQGLGFLNGKIGQDPWGQPYFYKFIENQEGTKTFVLVWSKGPDKHRDTDEAQVRQILETKTIAFNNDDLGVVKVFDTEKQSFD